MKAGGVPHARKFFQGIYSRLRFSRANAETAGEQAVKKKRGFLKTSTYGLAALFLLGKIKFYVTKNTAFEHKMRLVFPKYNSYLETDEAKQVQIVSENQLEHVIKLCNTYNKSIRCLNDHAISAYKGINIHIDYSKFN